MRRPDLGPRHRCGDCAVSAEAVCHVLPPPELGAFRESGSQANFTAGQTLFHEGDPASSVFSLTRGMVMLYTILADGRRHITDFLHPGDYIGTGEEGVRTLSAEAVGEVTACRFAVRQIEGMTTENPAFARAQYRKAASLLHTAERQGVTLACCNADERVTRFLCEMEARTRAVRPSRSRIIDLPMSRSDIGDHLGLSRESVSRSLARLARSGFIRIPSLRTVELVDLPSLRRIANGLAADQPHFE